MALPPKLSSLLEKLMKADSYYFFHEPVSAEDVRRVWPQIQQTCGFGGEKL
jgi:hypothetical protein